MRTISIKQPWASLTAAGIRNIEVSNRDTNYRGKVLIHASSRRVSRDFGHDIPIEQYMILRNAQALGLVPYDEEMPLSSVVGVAELTDCNSDISNSIWSADGNNWILDKAMMLDEPIEGIKGKQGLFDVPTIEETSLTKIHSTPTPYSHYDNGTFTLSMTDQEIERQLPHWPLVIMICEDGIANPIISEEKEGSLLKPISILELKSSMQTKKYSITSSEIMEETLYNQKIRFIVINLNEESD